VSYCDIVTWCWPVTVTSAVDFATLLRLSSLSPQTLTWRFSLRFLQCVLWLHDTSYRKKCLKGRIGTCLLGTRWCNFQPCTPTLRVKMHSVTDGQTDGQQDDANSRSYCVAVYDRLINLGTCCTEPTIFDHRLYKDDRPLLHHNREWTSYYGWHYSATTTGATTVAAPGL